MNITIPSFPCRRLAGGLLCLALAGCGGASPIGSAAAPAAESPSASGSAVSQVPGASVSPGMSPSDAAPENSQAPDVGGGTTAGDVPDNAVFLTYRQAALGFSIQYVEGWQVTTHPDGVLINDKDSSETVTVADLPSDLAAYISGSDLPALQGQAGFKLIKQNTV